MVLNGEGICTVQNQVKRRECSTAHAEFLAAEGTARVLGTRNLTGCHLYVTAEPCPMCMTAVLLSRVSVVICGTTIEDVNRLTHSSGIDFFRTVSLPMEEMVRRWCSSGPPPLLFSNFMREECLELLNMELVRST